MRISSSIFALSLLATAARADPQLTYVDDEPMSQRATASAPSASSPSSSASDRRLPAEVGELRQAAVAAPAPSSVGTGAAVAPEHDVAPPHTVGAVATSAELAAELGARQVLKQARRHQRALDACIAAAQRRRPTVVGTVTLAFDVANRKLAGVHVVDDSAHDFALDACLTSVARAFTFSLAAARFNWSISVTPTASR